MMNRSDMKKLSDYWGQYDVLVKQVAELEAFRLSALARLADLEAKGKQKK